MKPRNSLQSYAKDLRNSQLEGVKFRRQQPIEGYIVDFVSFEKRVVIELDGGQHAEREESDRQRDACLRANGFVSCQAVIGGMKQ